MKIKHIVNVSGGKDSTATLLLAIDRLGKENLEAVFADTQHEHIKTYNYLDYLEERLGIKIRRVTADFTERLAYKKLNLRNRWEKEGIDEDIIVRAQKALSPTGNVFLDACKANAGFPSPLRKFCTDGLKIMPIHKQVIEPLFQEGFDVIQWLGVRKEESEKRKDTGLLFTDRFYGRTEEEREKLTFNRRKGKVTLRRAVKFYPIRNWSVKDVFEFVASKNVEVNPLYEHTTRVGCAPCIFSRNAEMEFFLRDPEIFEKLKYWEEEVNKSTKHRLKVASFRQAGKTPGGTKKYRETGETPTIEDVREYLVKRKAELEEENIEFDGCESGYCES